MFVHVHTDDPDGRLTAEVFRITIANQARGRYLGAYGPLFVKGVAYTRSAWAIGLAFGRRYKLEPIGEEL